jgi:hypothetical protein
MKKKTHLTVLLASLIAPNALFVPEEPCAGAGSLTVGAPMECAEVTLMVLPTSVGAVYSQDKLDKLGLDPALLPPAQLEPNHCWHRIAYVTSAAPCLSEALAERSPSVKDDAFVVPGQVDLGGGTKGFGDPPGFAGSSFWEIARADGTLVVRWDYEAP